MHFRTKLLFAFIALAALSCLASFLSVFIVAKKALFEEAQRTALCMALEAASLVDGELHEQIWNDDDSSKIDSAAYRSIEEKLRACRDRHRQSGLDIAYIYTFRPSDNNESWAYVIDSEEPGDNKSLPGDPFVGEYEDGTPLETILNSPASADTQYSSDEFGDWLSAAAPVYNDSGKIVARAGIDLKAPDVRATAGRVFTKSLPVFALCLALGTLLAFYFSCWANRPLRRITDALNEIGNGDIGKRLTVNRTDEFALVEHAVNSMAESIQERNALQGSLARYVSRQTARDVAKINSEVEINTGGQKREIAVLFCSLDDFENLSEQSHVKDAVAVLNAFFEKMVSTVFSHGGTLDSFVGAGLMATFGAVNDDGDFIANALESAIAMRTDVEELAEEFEREHGVRVGIRIGIHTGPAVVCTRGEGSMMNFMALGKAVNNASRVLAEVRQSKYSLLVSKRVVAALEGRYQFMEVTTVPGGDD
ncbi:adenylate/guanylate cyclase domain-containing protein, partial [Verrucomicrobiales bacterium]|nr:adenylate/guanylate cyclase domain-containing protein [Verrucomicrobiales bacterium]